MICGTEAGGFSHIPMKMALTDYRGAGPGDKRSLSQVMGPVSDPSRAAFRMRKVVC
jgi:hypothetical protein